MTDNTSKKVNYEDFLKIYPPLTEKVDPATYKTFNKYFKKKEKKEDKKDEKNNSNEKKAKSKRKESTIDKKEEIEEENHIHFNHKVNIIGEEDDEWYLINKGIELQNKKRKRTNDIKVALELFLNQSDIISKLTKYFQQFEVDSLSTPEPPKSKNPQPQPPPQHNNNFDSTSILPKVTSLIKNKEAQEKIITKIRGITSKLTDTVKILKFKENEYIIKMFEIGEQCYFLVSGRLTVLKPVEHKNVKITYEEYFRYIITLYHNKEFELIEQLIELNRKQVNLHYLDNVLTFIKAYFIVKLNKDIANNKEIDLDYINEKFKEFYFTYDDYGLKESEIQYQISQIKYNNKNNNKNNKNTLTKEINSYLLSVFQPSFDDSFIMNKCKFLFDTRHEKESPGFSLLKYEIFINLFPGAFFGETALENTSKKRNASIRTEEDCIILSLNNETYGNLISDDSKKIKSLDVSFICNNFFFGNISPILFNKYYFPFFKAITKKKGEILYQQGREMTSIFLLKEGEVKFEIYCSVLDVYNLIKSLVYAIEKNNHLFKINEKEIKNIKDTYLNDSFYFNLRNKNDAFNEQLKLKKKILVYTCETFEIFGLIEYFLETNYNTTCYVNSLGAKLMEIQNFDLEKIINGEKLILTPYYQTVFNKILSQIKRLNNIKEDYIKQFEFKIREKIYDENISMNYFIKGQVGISKPYVREKIKIKPLYSDSNNSVSYKKDSDIKKSKNFDKNKNIRSSYVNNIPLINNDKVRKSKAYNLFIKTNNISDTNQTKKKYKSKDYKKNNMYNINIVKEENKMPTLYSSKNNESSSIKVKKNDPASNTIVNCGRKFLSLKQIKNKIRNYSNDMYDFNNFKTNEEKSQKKDENKEVIQTSFTKNDFGLSQSNFRYDLLSTGSKFKVFSKEKFNPYISYGSFGINMKKLGPNTSPTLSDRVSFWKSKQIHNFEEIKKFNARKKLMNTVFVNPIETKMRGSNTFINHKNLYNNTFLLSQTRNLRDY